MLGSLAPLLTDGPCVLGSLSRVCLCSPHTPWSVTVPRPSCFDRHTRCQLLRSPGVCSPSRFALSLSRTHSNLVLWLQTSVFIMVFFCFMMILHSGERLLERFLERLFLSGLGIPRDGEQLAWEHDFHRQTKPAKTLILGLLLCLALTYCAVLSHSVVSDSLWPRGLQPARLLCPWDSPGKNTGVGCHALLQGIFWAQGSNPGLPHRRQILYCLDHQGSPSSSHTPNQSFPALTPHRAQHQTTRDHPYSPEATQIIQAIQS